MKRVLMAAAAALVMLALAPARAAKGTVALVPAHVVRGAAENGPVITDALRASLEKEGFTVLPEDKVQGAIAAAKLDLGNQQNIVALSALRTSTGADWVVYPRVLSAGLGVNAKGERQANILLNVVGPSRKSFVHTRQIGHVFADVPEGPKVMDRGAADAAAAELLKGFYAKAGK